MGYQYEMGRRYLLGKKATRWEAKTGGPRSVGLLGQERRHQASRNAKGPVLSKGP